VGGGGRGGGWRRRRRRRRRRVYFVIALLHSINIYILKIPQFFTKIPYIYPGHLVGVNEGRNGMELKQETETQ
jgi:hypothetical protein